MKKNRIWVTAALIMTAVITGCSTENGEGIDEQKMENVPVDSSFIEPVDSGHLQEVYVTSRENNLIVARDESGRVTYVEAFSAGQDNLEKLMKAPSSFEDISFLFPMSEGNEIKLTRTGDNPPIGDYPGLGELADYPQYFEDYTQYYKGVPVVGNMKRINYFMTPEGKRMSVAIFGPVVDVNNLNTLPSISEQQARQVLADYLDVKADDSWPCELQIREFSTKKDGKIQRDVRLVYHIEGPLAPMDPNVYYFMAPRYYATIDAHTGLLIAVYS